MRRGIKNVRRVLAGILALLTVVTYVPNIAYAAETDGEIAVEEAVAETSEFTEEAEDAAIEPEIAEDTDIMDESADAEEISEPEETEAEETVEPEEAETIEDPVETGNEESVDGDPVPESSISLVSLTSTRPVYDKTFGDLVSGTTTEEDGVIKASLLFADGYKAYEGTNPSEMAGHFLPLKFESTEEGDLFVEFTDTTSAKGALSHPADDIAVLRVENSTPDTKVIVYRVFEGATEVTEEPGTNVLEKVTFTLDLELQPSSFTLGDTGNFAALCGDTEGLPTYPDSAKWLRSGELTFDYEKMAILGTLNKVYGYAAFSENEDYQDGYFLPFCINDDYEDALYEVYVNGNEEPIKPVSGSNFVIPVTADSTKLTVKQYVDGTFGASSEFDISGLELNDADNRISVKAATDDDKEGYDYYKSQEELSDGNLEVKDNEITGSLRYVENYTEFSSYKEEQSGHYLSLEVDIDCNAKSYKVEYTNVNSHSTPKPSTDFNDVWIFRMENQKSFTDSNAEATKLVVTAYADEDGTKEICSKTYDLSKLVLMNGEVALYPSYPGHKLLAEDNEEPTYPNDAKYLQYDEEVFKINDDCLGITGYYISAYSVNVAEYKAYGSKETAGNYLALCFPDAPMNGYTFTSDFGTKEGADFAPLNLTENGDLVIKLGKTDSFRFSAFNSDGVKVGDYTVDLSDVSKIKRDVYGNGNFYYSPSVLGTSSDYIQTNIEIGSDNKVYGTSKWVYSYDGYSEGAKGNFLALDFVLAGFNQDEIDFITEGAKYDEENDIYVYDINGKKNITVKAVEKETKFVLAETSFDLSTLKLEKPEAKVIVRGDIYSYYGGIQVFVNGVKKDCRIVEHETESGIELDYEYTLKEGESYTLTVEASRVFIGDIKGYRLDKADAKLISAKNGKFTYNGVAKAEGTVVYVETGDFMYKNNFPADVIEFSKVYNDIFAIYTSIDRYGSGMSATYPLKTSKAEVCTRGKDGKLTEVEEGLFSVDVNEMGAISLKAVDEKTIGQKYVLAIYGKDVNEEYLASTSDFMVAEKLTSLKLVSGKKKVTKISQEVGTGGNYQLAKSSKNALIPADAKVYVEPVEGTAGSKEDLVVEIYPEEESVWIATSAKAYDITKKYSYTITVKESDSEDSPVIATWTVDVKAPVVKANTKPILTLAHHDEKEVSYLLSAPKSLKNNGENLVYVYNDDDGNHYTKIDPDEEYWDYDFDAFPDESYTITAQIAQYPLGTYDYKNTTPLSVSDEVELKVDPLYYASTAKDMTVKQKAKSGFNGQYVTLANIKFAKNVTNKDVMVSVKPIGYAYYNDFMYNYDPYSGDLKIGFLSPYSGKFSITIEAAHPEMSRTFATKSLSFSLKNSASYVYDSNTFDSSNDVTVLKKNNKATTVKLNSTAYFISADGYLKPVKNSSKKIKYSIDEDESVCNGGISIKKNVLTIPKDYVFKNSDGCDFVYVVASYENYPGDTSCNNAYYRIYLKAEPVGYSELLLVEENYEGCRRVKEANISIHNLEKYSLKLRKSDVPVKDVYSSSELSTPEFLLKSSSKYVSPDYASIYCDKPAKNVVFSCTTEDGKKLKTSKYSFVATKADELGIQIDRDYANSICLWDNSETENTLYDGSVLNFQVVGKSDSIEPDDDVLYAKEFSNKYSISLKNAKIFKSQTSVANGYYSVAITDYSKPVTIILKDKTDSRKVITKEFVVKQSKPQLEVKDVSTLYAGTSQQMLALTVASDVVDLSQEFYLTGNPNDRKAVKLFSLLGKNTEYVFYTGNVSSKKNNSDGSVTFFFELIGKPAKGKYTLAVYSSGTSATQFTVNVKKGKPTTLKDEKLTLKKGEMVNFSQLEKIKPVFFTRITKSGAIIDGKAGNILETYFWDTFDDDSNFLGFQLGSQGMETSLETLNKPENNQFYFSYILYDGECYSVNEILVTITVVE